MIQASKRGYQLVLLILLQNEMVIGEMEKRGKQKQEASQLEPSRCPGRSSRDPVRKRSEDSDAG